MNSDSFRRILGLAGGVTLLSLLAAGVAAFKLREDALAEAQRQTAALARMLGGQVRQSAQSLDLALNEAMATVVTDNEEQFQKLARSAETARSLSAIADRRAAIDAIEIEDQGGVTLVNSRGRARDWRGPLYPARDEPGRDSARETMIGVPHVSDTTGAMVVDFTRRLASSDGKFLGVARIGVTPEALVSTYSPLSEMPDRSFALLTRDGSILSRYPSTARAIGQRLPQTSAWYGVVAGGGGVYEAVSAFDQKRRIIAVNPVPFSDLVVTVSVTRAAALAHWRNQVLAIAVCTSLALAIAAILMRALQIQFRRVAEKEAALRAQSTALELSNQRFATALENMSQGLVVFDKAGRVVISNTRYARMYALAPEEIPPGTPARDILLMRSAKGFYAGQTPEAYVRNAMGRTFTDQRIDHLTDGRSILVNHAACPDGSLVVTHEDVTEREQSNSRIAHMAMHDELTQLGNRALFLSALQSLKREIGDAYKHVVLLLIDLDAFKPVNDTFGHIAGDIVLRECAQRLLAAAPYAHVVARLGGDEFALAWGVVDTGFVDPESAARRLIAEISRPYSVHGETITIGACIGVAIHEDRQISTDDMLRRADLALYAAKADGANRMRMFAPDMERDAVTRRELAVDLANAIANDELYLVYQPIVDAKSRQIRQMEALLRWRHPVRGLIPPQEFVGLAEETRQIDALGEWAARRACAAAASWPEEVGLTVNVSPLQLASHGFVEALTRAIDSAGLASHRVEIEITETALLQNRGNTLGSLGKLRECGISIALDDFGTGFSSLSYLKQFRFDRLKIDRSFVADVARDAGSAAIVSATVELARAFHVEITAEGVETPAQYDALRAAGVGSMQGYLFGWPDDIENGLPAIPAPGALMRPAPLATRIRAA
ncbi:MAG: EAL domain-containing protein [Hyphomicrobiales bacterium]|nr:EAL domain-containing protein [Hyphomicrobiales bacterium]